MPRSNEAIPLHRTVFDNIENRRDDILFVAFTIKIYYTRFTQIYGDSEMTMNMEVKGSCVQIQP